MQVVIISGLPGVGKSAVADALCLRYDRMLHIDVSALRDMLQMGRLRPWDDSADGRRQHDLFVASACDMAVRFLDGGYGVVIEDVITRTDLQAYRERLAARTEPIHFVVLLPGRENIVSAYGRDGSRVLGLYEEFKAWTDAARIDPAGLSADVVADRIMSLAAEGKARLPGATG